MWIQFCFLDNIFTVLLSPTTLNNEIRSGSSKEEQEFKLSEKKSSKQDKSQQMLFSKDNKRTAHAPAHCINKTGKEYKKCKNFSSYSRTSPLGHPYSGKKKLWSWKNVHLIFAFVTFIKGHLYSGDTFCDPKGCSLNRGFTVFEFSSIPFTWNSTEDHFLRSDLVSNSYFRLLYNSL